MSVKLTKHRKHTPPPNTLSEWLEQLQEGDTVCVVTRTSRYIDKVTYVLKVRIVVGSLAFNRKTGVKTGPLESSNVLRIMPALEYDYDALHIRRRRIHARDLAKTMRLPDDAKKLEQLIKVLEKFQPK